MTLLHNLLFMNTLYVIMDGRWYINYSVITVEGE